MQQKYVVPLLDNYNTQQKLIKKHQKPKVINIISLILLPEPFFPIQKIYATIGELLQKFRKQFCPFIGHLLGCSP